MDLTMYGTGTHMGLLLMGNPGIPMLGDAFRLARKLLACENLELHPDFMLISKKDGKKAMGVEEAAQIIAKANYKPAIASQTIIVIDGIDCMTAIAQNKLLKLLEENNNVRVIAISYSENVLDTIKSRMQVIRYKTDGIDEFRKHMAGNTSFAVSESDILVLHKAGRGSYVMAEKLLEHIPLLQDTEKNLKDGDYVDLLHIFHLKKEKDKLAVTTNPLLMKAIIAILEAHFMNLLQTGCKSEDYESVNMHKIIMERIIQEENECEKITYTKEHFFQLMVFCIEHGRRICK